MRRDVVKLNPTALTARYPQLTFRRTHRGWWGAYRGGVLWAEQPTKLRLIQQLEQEQT